MAEMDGMANVVLVTGPSGAGRSTAIRAFEDMGYEAIDNMPLALLTALITGPSVGRSMALGIDVRTRDFSVRGVLEALEAITEAGQYQPSLMFLDCQTEALLRRYSETRRRHPLAPDDTPIQGIRLEQDLLRALRDHADVLIDTTPLTPHDLKREIAGLYDKGQGTGLAVSVQSFSYKRGVPRGIDMVLDCRFLRNPYWDVSLRDKCGLDAEVQAHVQDDARYDDFTQRVIDLTKLLLPAYRDEGKAHFSLGFGCSGGQHRSVTVAENVAEALAQDGWQVSKRHRELDRRGGAHEHRSDPG